MDHVSLSELNILVKKTLERELAPSYWVIAEISEIRVNPNGHCYLELVEKMDNKITAKMKGTIWSYTYSNLSLWFERMTGQSLKGGMKILFNAAVQFHEVYGLSLNIKDIDANYTIGERAVKRQQIIQQLQDDGVFDMNKEVQLPLVPKRIAIISSKTAAGYGDFMNQLSNNDFVYAYDTRLFQAQMQGDNAPQSIITALHSIHDSSIAYDLVVLIRGGGSQLDLDCFDNYELNSHIAQFPIPVITGIGHERDETIADLVANTALKTPTAVAEFLISGVRAFEENLEFNLQRVLNYSAEQLEANKQHLQQLSLRLAGSVQRETSTLANNLSIVEKQLEHSCQQFFTKLNNQLSQLELQIDLLSPDNVLRRGYTLTSLNNKFIKSSPKHGDELVTETMESKIWSTVNNVKKK